MPEVVIISGAFTEDPGQWIKMRLSCERLGANLHVIGPGRPFPGYPAMLEGIAYLKSITTPYVVHSCSYDVFLTRWDEAELIGAIESAGGLIVSTEAECWPAGPWCDVYKGGRGANGGQYCGRREQVIDFMETMYGRLGEVTAGGGNQEIIHRMLSDGYPAALDLNCEIFQSMSGQSIMDVSVHQGQFVNHKYGTFPMFVHFNGRTPGIDAFWKELNG